MNTPRHHDEKLRLELIAEASKALAKGGPAAVSLRDISAACNTSTTAIYSLFGGKKQLLNSVVSRSISPRLSANRIRKSTWLGSQPPSTTGQSATPNCLT